MNVGEATINISGQRVVREHPDRPQVSVAHYRHAYNCKGRLASYWHQVDETLKFHPARVLEVGCGSGYTHDALRREGVSVVTVDVDPALGPEIVASVRALPLEAKSVDVAICCQVLEHLPFDLFKPALDQLIRVARRGIVISLPDRDRFFALKLFGLERTYFRRVLEFPRRAGRRSSFIDEEHYWEIGHGKVNLERVMEIFRDDSIAHVRTYRVFEHPWHRFFVLTLKKEN